MNVLVEMLVSLKKRKPVKPNKPKNRFLKSSKEFGSLKMREPVNPESLKSKIFQSAQLCQTPKFSQFTRTSSLKICQNQLRFKERHTLTANSFIKTVKQYIAREWFLAMYSHGQFYFTKIRINLLQNVKRTGDFRALFLDLHV